MTDVWPYLNRHIAHFKAKLVSQPELSIEIITIALIFFMFNTSGLHHGIRLVELDRVEWEHVQRLLRENDRCPS